MSARLASSIEPRNAALSSGLTGVTGGLCDRGGIDPFDFSARSGAGSGAVGR